MNTLYAKMNYIKYDGKILIVMVVYLNNIQVWFLMSRYKKYLAESASNYILGFKMKFFQLKIWKKLERQVECLVWTYNIKNCD